MDGLLVTDLCKRLYVAAKERERLEEQIVALTVDFAEKFPLPDDDDYPAEDVPTLQKQLSKRLASSLANNNKKAGSDAEELGLVRKEREKLEMKVAADAKEIARLKKESTALAQKQVEQLVIVAKEKVALHNQIASLQAANGVQLEVLAMLHERNGKLLAQITGPQGAKKTPPKLLDLKKGTKKNVGRWLSPVFYSKGMSNQKLPWQAMVDEGGDGRMRVWFHNRSGKLVTAGISFTLLDEHRNVDLATFQPNEGKGLELMDTAAFAQRCAGCALIQLRVEMTIYHYF